VVPLAWADGVFSIGDLDAYASTGFNAVVVRLSWRMTPDGQLVSSDLEARPPSRAPPPRAAGRHLQPAPAPYGMENTFRVSADSAAYFALWTTWVQTAIAQVKDTPNLIGWMLPDDPRSLPFSQDEGFSRWIAGNFANVDVLNKQWAPTTNRSIRSLWAAPRPSSTAGAAMKTPTTCRWINCVST